MTNRTHTDLGAPINYHITTRRNEEIFSTLGAIVASFSEIEFILTDIALLLSNDPRYFFKQKLFPSKFSDKIKFFKRVASVESAYQPLILEIVDLIDECGVEIFDQNRATWAHSKISIDKNGTAFLERFHRKSGSPTNVVSHIYSRIDDDFIANHFRIADRIIAESRLIHRRIFELEGGPTPTIKDIPGFND